MTRGQQPISLATTTGPVRLRHPSISGVLEPDLLVRLAPRIHHRAREPRQRHGFWPWYDESCVKRGPSWRTATPTLLRSASCQRGLLVPATGKPGHNHGVRERRGRGRGSNGVCTTASRLDECGTCTRLLHLPERDRRDSVTRSLTGQAWVGPRQRNAWTGTAGPAPAARSGEPCQNLASRRRPAISLAPPHPGQAPPSTAALRSRNQPQDNRVWAVRHRRVQLLLADQTGPRARSTGAGVRQLTALCWERPMGASLSACPPTGFTLRMHATST